MAIEFPVFVICTLIFDHPSRRKFGQRGDYHRTARAEVIQDEDSDVEDERIAVYEQEDRSYNEDIVRVVDLRKEYKNGKVAVRNLTFSILPDEVFGFLGTNGAGKTTTISILCQEFMPTSGSAYICGYDIVQDSAEALQCIGYCPQFDATLDLLTVEEHLYLYAGIRGIVSEQRTGVVEGLMVICDIEQYRNIVASKLSGGNRRKLSVAIALIGSPQVILLDEPSAGMDPVARRGLWGTIQTVARYCSIVLTTHHLEEVEALADTVAIMANGALRCIGDKIHLKNKYGSGFEMSIRIADKELRYELHTFIKEIYSTAILNEYKSQRFIYALPQQTRLSEAFQILQDNKERFTITDYSISQTSIEQVFLRISEHEELLILLGIDKANSEFTQSHAKLQHYNGNSTLKRRSEREKEIGDGKDDGSEEATNGCGTLEPYRVMNKQQNVQRNILLPMPTNPEDYTLSPEMNNVADDNYYEPAMQYNVNEMNGNYYNVDGAVYNGVDNAGVNDDCVDDNYYSNDNANYYDSNYKEADWNKVSALSQNNITNSVGDNIDINNNYNDYYSQFNSQYANSFYDNVNYNESYAQYSPYMEDNQPH